jgi:hypothetical protein
MVYSALAGCALIIKLFSLGGSAGISTGVALNASHTQTLAGSGQDVTGARFVYSTGASSSSFASARNIYSSLNLNTNVGTINNATSIYVDSGVTAGTVTNGYQMYIAPCGFGTARYGLYVQAPTGGTNNYALYADDICVGSTSGRIAGGLYVNGQARIAGLATTNALTYADANKQLTSVTLGTSLSFSSGTLDAIQDIRTTASPSFAGLNIASAPVCQTGSFSSSWNADVYGDISFTVYWERNRDQATLKFPNIMWGTSMSIGSASFITTSGTNPIPSAIRPTTTLFFPVTYLINDSMGIGNLKINTNGTFQLLANTGATAFTVSSGKSTGFYSCAITYLIV